MGGVAGAGRGWVLTLINAPLRPCGRLSPRHAPLPVRLRLLRCSAARRHRTTRGRQLRSLVVSLELAHLGLALALVLRQVDRIGLLVAVGLRVRRALAKVRRHVGRGPPRRVPAGAAASGLARPLLGGFFRKELLPPHGVREPISASGPVLTELALLLRRHVRPARAAIRKRQQTGAVLFGRGRAARGSEPARVARVVAV
mmetsp:Transcript_41933/g.97041  ORF Transcript_41933/g.97041 Transcript_41933/m.97041 type:complete len:200 (-) Transcript_41933:984-1583(-)